MYYSVQCSLLSIRFSPAHLFPDKSSGDVTGFGLVAVGVCVCLGDAKSTIIILSYYNTIISYNMHTIAIFQFACLRTPITIEWTRLSMRRLLCLGFCRRHRHKKCLFFVCNISFLNSKEWHYSEIYGTLSEALITCVRDGSPLKFNRE